MKNFRPTVLISALLLILISCTSIVDSDQQSFAFTQDAGTALFLDNDEPQIHDSREPFTSDEAAVLMDSLISFDTDESRRAIEIVRSRNDPTFIAVMIELMRAAQIGLVEDAGFPQYVEILEELSAESFGEDWPAWINWYGAARSLSYESYNATETSIKEGYHEFKLCSQSVSILNKVLSRRMIDHDLDSH